MPTNVVSNPAVRPLSSSKFDENLILLTLEEKGLMVPESSKAQLFMTCSELESGSISPDQFLAIAKTLVSATPFKPAIDLYGAIQEVANQLRAANAAENLRLRYLSGFETAKGLASESVKIVVAVKEVVEDSFDDHELVHLQADSLSIREFLRDETIPFLQEVEKRGVDGVPVHLIRRKRAELKEKIEIQRRNVNVHLQRTESGINNMTQKTYYVKTNHLPRYAAASALEVLLRGYYALMGQFDPEDIMVDSERSQTQRVADERITSIMTLFKLYGEKRQSVVGSKNEWIDEELWQRFHYYIYDEGSTGDQLCPKVEIADIAILFSAGKATIKQTEDGVLYYSYKSMSGTDQTIAPGRNLLQATLDDVNSRLEKGGLVWQQFLQPHVERIELVLDTVLGRRLDRLLRGGKITTAPQIPKTIPVLNFRPEDWADTVPCGFDSFAPDTPEAERTKLYYMLYSIAGKKLAGEWCHNLSTGLVPYGPISLSAPAHRCEILLDATGFEWVSASHGHIPTLAIPLALDTSSNPVYMASVTVTTDEGLTFINPADMLYETQEGGGLRYKYANYCYGKETRGVDEYKILCREEEKR